MCQVLAHSEFADPMFDAIKFEKRYFRPFIHKKLLCMPAVDFGQILRWRLSLEIITFGLSWTFVAMKPVFHTFIDTQNEK